VRNSNRALKMSEHFRGNESYFHAVTALMNAAESATAPKTPPCILIIFSAARSIARIGGAGAVREHQAFVAAVVRLAHRRMDAHVRGDAREHDI